MNKKLEIYGACWHKIPLHHFFLITDDPNIGCHTTDSIPLDLKTTALVLVLNIIDSPLRVT